ncbi:hypothetical protein ARALYDRAFT_906520 [Arabidopsis lyrata subsp. lyrata]|uniref:Uncharacterized protein n=1 Tax=Arabidopsis lyrata subsp. lyrata TaxID=81972 RepID=D7LTX5_ARALL|nr:hypothetical protein ARALYDRAFT_906520 [Arabidopsis lyrata subsp. lyrata]
MALIRKDSSSASLDEIKRWKIKVQIVRTCKGNNKESGNSIDMVLLDSSVWLCLNYIPLTCIFCNSIYIYQNDLHFDK